MRQQELNFEQVHQFVEDLLGEDFHAKRVYALSNATLGVMTASALAISTIGHGLAVSRSLSTKHAIKQIDRLLSNQGVDLETFFKPWVCYAIGARPQIEVALDWTDFDADGHSTIMLSLLTQHGRATPLVWLTVEKETLKANRSRYEQMALIQLAQALPLDVEVLIIADRGFGDHKLYEVLTYELKFDYLIRFRGNIQVTAMDGEVRKATDWVAKGGRTRILRGAAVTAQGYLVGAVVCVQAKNMKSPWCLVTSLKDEKAKVLLAKYGKRWGIEASFRDVKDPHFGLGMNQARVNSPERRDRLWLILTLAIALLTLLGAAGEATGLDRMLKSNTSPKRQHSLFRQGCMHYQQIPNMKEERLRILMQKFGEILTEIKTFSGIYGII